VIAAWWSTDMDITTFQGTCEYCDEKTRVMEIPSLGINVDAGCFRSYQAPIEVAIWKSSRNSRAEIAAVRHAYVQMSR
jgi:hypothetical protein